MSYGATLPPAGLPGLDAAWSRLVRVEGSDGAEHTWHVLDSRPADSSLTVLCVHGNPTWSYLWRRLFTTAPPSWRVIAPDLLGMGFSDRLDAPRTLAERVSDLSALTEALDVSGPVVTVAHDWGGSISLGWAAEHRAQLRGVVLTNTAVHLPEGLAGPVLIRLAHLPALRTAVCTLTPTFVRGATALSRPALPADIRNAFAAPYVGARRRRSVGDFVADIPFEASHPSHRPLERIAESTRGLEAPALLLWGPRDPVFGQPYLDDLLERLPQAQVHRYERASHLVTEDAPQYAAAVVAWVSDLDEPPAALPEAERRGVRDAAATSTLSERLVARAGDPAPAVVDVGRVAISWDLLARRVDEIASGLAAAGVRPGDRVALLVPPSADLTAAVYAVWRAGAVIVVADKGLGLLGMGRALRGARANHLVGSAQGLAAARAMRLPGTRFAAGTAPRWVLRALGAELTLTDIARIGRGAARPTEPAAEDECAVVFTSGATGPAKGVVYRHRQVGFQLELIRSTYTLSDADRIVAAFAPFALYGPALGIGSAVPEMDVTSPGTLTASALADAVTAVDATVIFSSPAALRSVLTTAEALSSAQRTAFGGIRLVMSAGAPVPLGLLRSLGALLPAAEIHTPYGMTEALPVTDISLPEIEAAGPGNGVCVGRPLPGVDVTVSELSSLGAADGPLTAEAGSCGEVCVRADHLKDRYDALWAVQWSSSRNDGWHRTGDVGHLDEQGRLWIEGRLEHVISTANGVVTPVGVEQKAEALDAVGAAAVVGVGPVGVQQVVVVVVPEGVRRPRWSSPVAAQPLLDDVRRAADVEIAAVLVVPELPVDIRHASKVDRRKVQQWAGEVLAGTNASRAAR